MHLCPSLFHPPMCTAPFPPPPTTSRPFPTPVQMVDTLTAALCRVLLDAPNLIDLSAAERQNLKVLLHSATHSGPAPLRIAFDAKTSYLTYVLLTAASFHFLTARPPAEDRAAALAAAAETDAARTVALSGLPPGARDPQRLVQLLGYPACRAVRAEVAQDEAVVQLAGGQDHEADALSCKLLRQLYLQNHRRLPLVLQGPVSPTAEVRACPPAAVPRFRLNDSASPVRGGSHTPPPPSPLGCPCLQDSRPPE